MSYWNKHPEKLDEIVTKFLPELWKTLVDSEKTELCDIPYAIRFKAMQEGEEDYWAEMTSHAMDLRKERKTNACSSVE